MTFPWGRVKYFLWVMSDIDKHEHLGSNCQVMTLMTYVS